ncbi:hypothetical protein C8Q73DRAFT_48307 [Cubamyces lactineus]|nr:hypothetical protein C8Q73DRAFT_48307 [Cubamyces lactineus]
MPTRAQASGLRARGSRLAIESERIAERLSTIQTRAHPERVSSIGISTVQSTSDRRPVTSDLRARTFPGTLARIAYRAGYVVQCRTCTCPRWQPRNRARRDDGDPPACPRPREVLTPITVLYSHYAHLLGTRSESVGQLVVSLTMIIQGPSIISIPR